MTARLLALDLLATYLVAACWISVTAALGRARIAAVLLAAALVVTAGRVVLVVVLAGSGWWFVQEKFLLTLPLIVVPAIVAGVLAGPALLRGTRPGQLGTAALLIAAGGGVAGVLGTLVVGYPVTVPAVLGLVVVTLAPAAALVPVSRTVRRVGVAVTAALTTGMVAIAWATSLQPDHAGHTYHGVSVADLRGPGGEPARRFVLTARRADVVLPGGRVVSALTFDGTVPGPELVVTQGELVEVVLRNADVAEGVTLHWHGYPVPAGEDGVAGVTQDAVPPGGTFTYRFQATVAGTFWYHTHQRSAETVRRGLYGLLIVRPPAPEPGLDLALAVHTFDGTLTTGAPDRVAVAPGTPVRLRMVDTDGVPHTVAVRGTGFRIVAVDGHELPGGSALDAMSLVPLAAGGRVDLAFTMPDGPVALSLDGRAEAALTLGDGAAPPPPTAAAPQLDLTQYVPVGPSPLGAYPHFDQEVTLVLDRTLGFLHGIPALTYPLNGRVYPAVPPITVRTGDVVKLTVVNRGSEPHPMHPHGHAVLVLARNGVPASGPLWTDSFDVGPGEVWEVALHADNPGVWMSHCHNLEHAVAGMVMHLVYDGVGTPFEVGSETGNDPE